MRPATARPRPQLLLSCCLLAAFAAGAGADVWKDTGCTPDPGGYSVRMYFESRSQLVVLEGTNKTIELPLVAECAQAECSSDLEMFVVVQLEQYEEYDETAVPFNDFTSGASKTRTTALATITPTPGSTSKTAPATVSVSIVDDSTAELPSELFYARIAKCGIQWKESCNRVAKAACSVGTSNG